MWDNRNHPWPVKFPLHGLSWAFENKHCGGDAKENLDGEVAGPQESAEARVTQAFQFLTCQSC